MACQHHAGRWCARLRWRRRQPTHSWALDAVEHGRAVLWARLAGGAGTAAARDTAVLAGARQAA
eukprot:346181-Chlamydomonas_euryale.AAC.1